MHKQYEYDTHEHRPNNLQCDDLQKVRRYTDLKQSTAVGRLKSRQKPETQTHKRYCFNTQIIRKQHTTSMQQKHFTVKYYVAQFYDI